MMTSVLLLALAGIAVGIAAFKADMVRVAFKKQPFDTLEASGVFRDPQIRRIVYGRLDHEGDVDYYTFTTTRGTPIRISLRTPVADRDSNPMLVVFGPGLPTPTTDPGIGIGETNGAIVGTTGRDARTAVFMLASLTTFYLGPHIETVTPQDGTYAVAVTDRSGSVGRYVLEVGGMPERSFDVFISFAVGTIRAILRLY
ncbi:hypothetical protein KKF45_02755 [Patescibacteria group bacterium]|nr:hypothetical protein [Patescibacteria group bacterium]